MTDASVDRTPASTPAQVPAHPQLPDLAAGFPEQGREEWQRLVAAVLNKGRADADRLDGPQAEAALRRHLEGGLEVDALYLREERALGVPGAMPFTRGRALREASTPWDVCQLHDDPDVAATRAAVLDDLEHGVTSVWLHVGADGLAVADLPEALADVRLDLAPVVVSSVTDQPAAARALLDHVGRARVGGRQPRPRPVRRRRPAGLHPRPRPARRPGASCAASTDGAPSPSTPPCCTRPAPPTSRRSPWPSPPRSSTCAHLEGAGVPVDEAFGQIDCGSAPPPTSS